MLKKSVLTIAMSALLALTAAGQSFAESKTKKLKATRAQVASACESSGGLAWGTEATSGGYGCVTDNAWIDCDEGGDCEGGTASRTASRTPAFRADLGLRLAR